SAVSETRWIAKDASADIVVLQGAVEVSPKTVATNIDLVVVDSSDQLITESSHITYFESCLVTNFALNTKVVLNFATDLEIWINCEGCSKVSSGQVVESISDRWSHKRRSHGR